MVVKIALIFLVLMAVLALFGRFRFPSSGPSARAAGKCRKCGRHLIGKGPCPCGKGSV